MDVAQKEQKEIQNFAPHLGICLASLQGDLPCTEELLCGHKRTEASQIMTPHVVVLSYKISTTGRSSGFCYTRGPVRGDFITKQ